MLRHFSVVILIKFVVSASTGPSFLKEPPSRVEFANDTGARIDCVAGGSPQPILGWLASDSKPLVLVPRLLDVLPNGSLHFAPFHPSAYRHDLHAAIYRCIASNSVGKIISRDVRVKAVVLQYYEMQVQFKESVIRGNTAVLRCSIPGFVKEYITVTSWLQDSSFNIYPSIKGDGKYHMLPNGELLVRRVDDTDKYRSYQCRAVNRLTGETLLSVTRARFAVVDTRLPAAPRALEKISSLFQVRKDQFVIIPCYTEANPPPEFEWYRLENQQMKSVTEDDRIFVIGECLVILHADEDDAGKWVCVANNTAGEERFDFTLQVKSPLAVSIEPSDQVTADVGSYVELHCLVSGGGTSYSRTWLKDGHVIGPPVRSDTSTLLLSRIQREDAGMYQCLVRIDDDSAQSSVQLILGAAHPQLVYKFIHQTLQPGPPVSLKCIATGNPTPHINWKLDGFPLPQIDRFVIGQYVTLHGDVISHVNISSVRIEDGGIYQCTATNRLGFVSHSAQMRVYGPPFVRPMPNVSAVAGEALYIACPVAGYPIDAIIWEKDGKKLPINRRQHIFPNGTLLINNVQRDLDKGMYRCTAGNKQGVSASQNLAIGVIVPPKIAPFSFEMDLHLEDRAGVQCFVTKGDLPLTIRWMKDGEDVNSDEQKGSITGISVRQLGEFTSSVSIKSLQPHHAGTYTCSARNQAANTTHSSTLLVNVPPRWVSEPQDRNVSRGEMVVFHCQADGFPVPTLVWKKVVGGQRLNGYQDLNSRNRGLQVSPNGTLLISQAQPEHQGQYLCEATNGIGAGLSTTVTLVVLIPPEFEVKSAQVSVRRGLSQTLKCQAAGDQPMSITWQRNGSQTPVQFNPRYLIKESAMELDFLSELQISNTVKSDSGTYTCTATNPFGHAERTVNLQVQDAPGRPHDVRVVDSGSRSVKLSWSPPLDDESLTLQYIVQYKQDSDNDWQSVAAGVNQVGMLMDLQPASLYTIRVVAENELGAGELSEPILLRTESEAPTAQPQNVVVTSTESDQLKVVWSAPAQHHWNGEILGYNIGFRTHGVSRSTGFNFTTVPPQTGGSGFILLKGLKKFTQYGIVVQAFNEKGLGPLSNEIFAQTSEDVPSAPPLEIKCSPQSSQTLTVKWQSPPQMFINGKLQGYKVYYENMEDLPEGRIESSTKVTQEVSTDLHGLQKYSNYSIQVWAFTKVGEGVKSKPIFCVTEEDVPDAPSGIKVMVSSPSSLIVSWGVPYRPNGQLISYTVYSRVLKSGREKDSFKKPLPPTQTHYQALDLHKGEAYEFWVTAFTRVGEGQSTKVVYGTISNRVPASVISFGRALIKLRYSIVKMDCLAVGIPPPKRSWFVPDGSQPSDEVFSQHADGSLEISEIQRHHQGNYTCSVTNINGSDQITYSLHVLVTPAAPLVTVSGTGSSWIEFQWSIIDDGGSVVRGLTLNIKQEEQGEWEERSIPRGMTTYRLTGLTCGTQYNIQVMAYNRVGTGTASHVVITKTDGSKPEHPSQADFIEVNVTTIVLYLNSWKDKGCPILSFVIEYREGVREEWVTVGRDVQMKESFVVTGLWPGTQYIIKVTTINSAGSTIFKYTVNTLPVPSIPATISLDSVKVLAEEDISSYVDTELVILLITSSAAIVLFVVVTALCLCKKTERDSLGGRQGDGQAMVALSKHNISQREQYYAAVHKGITTPVQDIHCIERIPEYADDITPYATFHVTNSEKPSASPGHVKSFIYHDSRLDSMETMQLKSTNPRDDYAKLRSNSKGSKCVVTGSDYSGSVTEWSEHGLANSTIPVQNSLYGSSIGGPESSTSPEASPIPDRRAVPPHLRAHVRNAQGTTFQFPIPLDPPSRFSDSRELKEAECDLESLYKHKLRKRKRVDMMVVQHKYSRHERNNKLYDLTIAV
ncbi:cell adhesion molecule Dscam2-like [Lycorma delicatula]|uniref:cell adhesion molecule Dscam2-like n=1 Tax=Lycorma delicatula TaxID=130591 RepID=UPI003F518D05